ncbi:MAG: VacB/RNase II family 3'-5' exoribonuclease [Clostridia bacterium]|nr:VacB/RNase II family 3'-5' exoribonuclease [Clostridia bacterium]
MKKKDFTKFTKRNTHKRRSKDAARAELMRAVREVSSDYEGFKIRDSYDGGRRDRVTGRVSRDERVAEGIFAATKSGFGFVTLPEGSEDIFIPERKTLGAIDSDRVEIIYHEYKDRDGTARTEGRVTKILEYGRKSIIGTLDEEVYRHGRRTYRSYVLIPDDPRAAITPYVTDTMGAEIGDKVEARLIRHASAQPDCTVMRIFGHTESREANYAAILAEVGIETEFSPEVIAEAEMSARDSCVTDGRERYSDFIMTIDGAGAKDLDDAVSVSKTDFGYRLGVYIADVSSYVKEKTALDRCATARGTSVYFVDKVVPMLPPVLSNGVCSLNAGEEKLTLSALIDLSPDGEILNTRLAESVITSRIRGVYSEVNRIFDGSAEDAILEKYNDAIPHLNVMRELYEILAKRRRSAGYIDFDSPEAELILNELGEVSDIVKRERGISERIIEQLMLIANEAVATHLHERGIPCVYRVHDEPPKEKLDEFINYAHTLGFDTSVITKREVSGKAFSALLAEAQRRDMLEVVSYPMLRAMSKAEYSSALRAHFGLGLECYCHFTSPIRRLSDLATHRIIKQVLLGEKKPQAYASYANRMAAAATEAERRAEEAERRIEDLYKALYMVEHLGDTYPAFISGISRYGIFCRLDNTCEGLIPISELPGVFTFDEKTLTVRSRDISYHLMDRIEVCLEEVDIIRGKLRFSII